MFFSFQVISNSFMGFFDVDSRFKALGDELSSFEKSLVLLKAADVLSYVVFRVRMIGIVRLPNRLDHQV